MYSIIISGINGDLVSGSTGGFNTSVDADLFYFYDTLTSYILRCHVPHESLLWV